MSRPYLEVKVIEEEKVKKGKKNNKCEHEYGLFRCLKCGKVLEEWIPTGSTTPKKNGNWVNGENLDKIKFPAPCRYGGGMLGMITRTKANESMDEDFYTLHDIGKQHSSYSSVRSYYNFRDLIEVWDIHILKAKIILFEEKNK